MYCRTDKLMEGYLQVQMTVWHPIFLEIWDIYLLEQHESNKCKDVCTSVAAKNKERKDGLSMHDVVHFQVTDALMH